MLMSFRENVTVVMLTSSLSGTQKHITAYKTLTTTMNTGQQQVILVWQNTAGSKCEYKKLGRVCVKKMSDDQ